MGFQSSDSSSLDSDSSISDNETSGLTFMESENQTDDFIDLSNDEQNEKTNFILKENGFLLNSLATKKRDELNDFSDEFSRPDEHSELGHQPIKCITNLNSKSSVNDDEFTITEFNSKIKRTKNTSIQTIISQYERQQMLVNEFKELKKRSAKIERQNSFDAIKLDSKQPFLKALKQRHLFPSRSIDQPMDLEETENASKKFSFVKKNFEKLLTPLNQLKQQQKEEKKSEKDSNKITLIEKQIEKPTSKHLTIKQCIRKIDLNTTHQNIIKHLENDVSLNQNQSESSKPSIRTNKSSTELTQLNTNFKPHCPIIVKNTKEIAGYNTISDAFLKLDFYNAIRDIRRFNYVCKLLHLLITQNLTSLSGCATKFLFNLLEEIAFQGSFLSF